jgi:hypothetical protein
MITYFIFALVCSLNRAIRWPILLSLLPPSSPPVVVTLIFPFPFFETFSRFLIEVHTPALLASMLHHLAGSLYYVSTAFIRCMFFFRSDRRRNRYRGRKKNEKYVQLGPSHLSLDSGWCAEIASLIPAIYVPHPLVTNKYG